MTPSPQALPSRPLLALALAALTVALYLPVRHHQFLNYDDDEYVTANPRVTAGLTRETIVWAWTEPHSATWHPLTTLSHVLDCHLFGLDPGPPHLVNVGLHALNTVLLFLVFARMTGHPWPSAWAAALFGVHPLHIESVAWVAERKDVLSTLFWMATLWAYTAYARAPSRRGYALVLLAYLAALLSKPMVVTLPFVLLLLDLWPLERWRPGARHGRPAELRRLLLEKVPLVLLAGGASAVTLLTQHRAGAVVSWSRSSLEDRIANALVSYVAYLGKMLWPSGLAPIYPFEAPLPVWQVAGATLLLSGITLAAVRLFHRAPYVLVGWLWYTGTLVPVIGIVQYGSHAMADRYTYIPSIGVGFAVAWGVPALLRGVRQWRWVCAVVGTAALALYSAVTTVQLRHWRDSLSLFRHTLAVTRSNLVAELHLGDALAAQGHTDEAARHLARGRTIYREAEIRHFTRVVQRDPQAAEAHVNLGRLFAEGGNDSAAIAHYREAIRLNPSIAAAHNNLAVLLENAGDTAGAITHYREGVRLEPQRAESLSNLAAALASAGRLPEAIDAFGTALALNPRLAEARLGRASAYIRTGQDQHAATELEGILREHPDRTAAATMLAWLLATTADAGLRDGARAVQLAEGAARQTNFRDPEVLDSLAAAYAETGRFAEATATATRALDLARNAGRPALANALARRVSLYHAGRSAREPAQKGAPEAHDLPAE